MFHPFSWVCVLKWVNSGKIGHHPVATGELLHGPSAVCPPAWLWGEDTVMYLLEKPRALRGPCYLIKVDRSDNKDALHKKSQRRHFLLRRLRSFRGQGLLRNLYTSMVASAIVYGVICRTGPGQVKDGEIGPTRLLGQ